MPRKVKKTSGLYQFLIENGILENGTHEQIQSARKEYWREYKRKWRKKQRSVNKAITVSLTRNEWQLLTHEAQRHKTSRTRFLKQASIAYMSKTFVVPDLVEVRRIGQLLSMVYNSVQKAIDEAVNDSKSGRIVLDSIQRLELEILPYLNHPKPLEGYIKDHILKDPDNKQRLLNYINSL